MNTSGKSMRSSAGAYADDVRHAGEGALDRTRHLASQVLERAGERVRDMRYGARDLASRGVDTASEAAVAAQRQLSRYADVTGRYVSEQPVRSVLIAVAAGAAIAALVLAARRRNRY